MTDNKEQVNKNIDFELNQKPEYKLLNKVLTDNIIKGETKVYDYFNKILSIKEKIIQDAKETLRTKYLEGISEFEKKAKEVTDKVDHTDINDEKELKKLKTNMDNLLNSIHNENTIKKHISIVDNLSHRLRFITMKQIQDPSFVFSLQSKNGSLYWKSTNSPLLTVPSEGSSYKCYSSQEVFEDELTFTMKIKSIDVNNVNSYWNFCFGLIKNGSETNQSNYYDYSVIYQSNGSINTPFSGSSVTKNLPIWKNDDLLTVYRDFDGNVYFSVNYGEKVECFKEIKGDMRVVLGISTSYSGDIFEIAECIKKFT